ALAAWLVFGSALMLARRARVGEVSLDASLQMLRAQPRETFGVALAHAGAGLLVLGVVGASVWHSETTLAMAPGQRTAFAGSEMRLRDVRPAQGQNYQAARARLDVRRDGRAIAMLAPERRFYPERQSETTEAGVRTTLAGNLYAAIGARDERNR